MEAVQIQQVMARDGEILITGLPYKRGQAVEVGEDIAGSDSGWCNVAWGTQSASV